MARERKERDLSIIRGYRGGEVVLGYGVKKVPGPLIGGSGVAPQVHDEDRVELLPNPDLPQDDQPVDRDGSEDERHGPTSRGFSS